MRVCRLVGLAKPAGTPFTSLPLCEPVESMNGAALNWLGWDVGALGAIG